jgi:hypothetical protein
MRRCCFLLATGLSAFHHDVAIAFSQATAPLVSKNGNAHAAEDSKFKENRRPFLLHTAAMISGLWLSNEPALAKDDVFRGNPLTNSVLEKIRIWEQAEADDLKYGGELERGDAGNKGKVEAYPRLLVPILQMANELDEVERICLGSRDSWAQAQNILKQKKYQKIEFKKQFNAYSDNIYYSDPDRANLYLGGGATPKTEQSLAYLLRNDILTNVEALQSEIEYLLKEPSESSEDLVLYATTANRAMKRYMGIVPPGELVKARELIE